jgi:hypothetical protein
MEKGQAHYLLTLYSSFLIIHQEIQVEVANPKAATPIPTPIMVAFVKPPDF